MTVDELLNALGALPHGAIVPNAAQRAVMEHVGGPLWVIAGPGTGKTQALVLRTLRLLCVDGVAPDAIVLTTFTRKAAQQLELRLHEVLRRLTAYFPDVGQIDLSRMHLGTIHSICRDLLTASPASPFRHLQLLNEAERLFFVRAHSRICDDQTLDHRLLDLLGWAEQPDHPRRKEFAGSRWDRARIFTTLLERVIEDQVDLERLAAQGPHLAYLCDVIAEYQEALRKHHFTDYTTVQQQVLALLASPQGQDVLRRDQYHTGIEHIIVDEYQDTNPLQAAIYRALAAVAPHNLCVVGDDDQALYRFRGGTVTCMVRFAEECRRARPGCSVHTVALTETYRSHPAIARWINAFITVQPAMRHPGARVSDKPALSPVRPAHPPGPVVLAVGGENANAVAANFAALMAQLLAERVLASPAQCALLAHSVKEPTIGPYREALEGQGIELARPSMLRDHPVYQQALGTLLLALDPYGLLCPPSLGDPQFAQYVEGCLEKSTQDVVLSSTAHSLRSWLLADSDARRNQTLGRLMECILNVSPCAALIEQGEEALAAALAVQEIVDAYDRIVEQGRAFIPFDAAKQDIEEWWVKRIYTVLARGLYLGLLSEQADGSFAAARASALSLLTIHGAKGLEFSAVAVVVGKRGTRADTTHQLERAVLPYRRDLGETPDLVHLLGGDDEARAIQDEVRLHYVAYSRARDLLILLVPDSRWDVPPALGLGQDRDWFRQYALQWPDRQQRRRKRSIAATSAGGTTYELWGE